MTFFDRVLLGPDSVEAYILVGALMFIVGLFCMLTRRNFFGLLMGIELVLNGASLSFVAYSGFIPVGVSEGFDRIEPQVFSLFVIVLAAAEAVIAFALALALFQIRNTVDVTRIDDLKC
ncbi:MAG: NADH-quinone oxidoreductase subunit NuoK [Planctomycetes bacterium]|nr:NADH-quinone oxidoreductase subunit NuoK [Planctomycetota bacterium]